MNRGRSITTCVCVACWLQGEGVCSVMVYHLQSDHPIGLPSLVSVCRFHFAAAFCREGLTWGSKTKTGSLPRNSVAKSKMEESSG